MGDGAEAQSGEALAQGDRQPTTKGPSSWAPGASHPSCLPPHSSSPPPNLLSLLSNPGEPQNHRKWNGLRQCQGLVHSRHLVNGHGAQGARGGEVEAWPPLCPARTRMAWNPHTEPWAQLSGGGGKRPPWPEGTQSSRQWLGNPAESWTAAGITSPPPPPPPRWRQDNP